MPANSKQNMFSKDVRGRIYWQKNKLSLGKIYKSCYIHIQRKIIIRKFWEWNVSCAIQKLLSNFAIRRTLLLIDDVISITYKNRIALFVWNPRPEEISSFQLYLFTDTCFSKQKTVFSFSCSQSNQQMGPYIYCKIDLIWLIKLCNHNSGSILFYGSHICILLRVAR